MVKLMVSVCSRLNSYFVYTGFEMQEVQEG